MAGSTILFPIFSQGPLRATTEPRFEFCWFVPDAPTVNTVLSVCFFLRAMLRLGDLFVLHENSVMCVDEHVL